MYSTIDYVHETLQSRYMTDNENIKNYPFYYSTVPVVQSTVYTLPKGAVGLFVLCNVVLKP